MEVKRTISKHQILEQFYPHIIEVSKQFCGRRLNHVDIANNTYLVMYGLSVNKLTKILYDGGMKAYIWFVVQTEFAKEMNHRNRFVGEIGLLISEQENVEDFTKKFLLLNDDELKFCCILAQSNSLHELTTKHGFPRRYCKTMLNKIKTKLK